MSRLLCLIILAILKLHLIHDGFLSFIDLFEFGVIALALGISHDGIISLFAFSLCAAVGRGSSRYQFKQSLFVRLSGWRIMPRPG